MTHRVRLAPAAEDDLSRLLDFLLDRAVDIDDALRAQAVIATLRDAVTVQLARNPYGYRKAADGSGRSTRRELLVPAGAAGYVALYEIDSASSVVVLAVRHQLEEDYH